MSNRKQSSLKLGMLGIASTGLLWQAIPASAQTANSNPQSAPPQITRPLTRFDVGRRNSAPRRLPATQNANTSAMPVQQSGIAPGVASSAAPAQNPVQVATPVQVANPAPITNAVPVPTAGQPDVLQTSAANGSKSEVQKQLEALYEADGREVPDMTFNLQPLNPQGGVGTQQNNNVQQQPAVANSAAPGAQNARKVQGYTQYQPGRSQANPYPAPATTQNQQPNAQMAQASNEPAVETPQQGPYRPNPVLKFFKKINGTNRSQPHPNQAPVPPDYANNQTPATQPPVNRPSNVSPAWSLPAQTPTNMPPVLTQQAAPVQPSQAFSQNRLAPTPYVSPKTNSVPAQSALASTPHRPSTRSVTIPALSDSPMPIQTTSARSLTTKPKIESQIQPVIVKKSLNTIEEEKIAGTEKGLDVFNPFPDGSELEADVKIRPGQSEEITPPATVSITSKSDAEAPKAIEPPEELAQTPADKPADVEVAAKDEDNPFAVEAKDFLEPIVAETRDPAAPSLDGEPALVAPPAEDAKPANDAEPIFSPDADEVTDETEVLAPATSPIEKMKRIRERFGMKGLKGFCPVTLREDRELIDARTEFSSTHRGQRFHFATAEARDKFAENPSRYVPAAYGADVVALSRDKDVVEGTLDFAAWYKGRLYLFGSQDNYDTFITEPALYATIDGIE